MLLLVLKNACISFVATAFVIPQKNGYLEASYSLCMPIPTTNIMPDTAHRFYSAFQRLNAEDMVACYQPNAEFEDPGFGKLVGEEVFWMWRMLCANAKEFNLTFEVLEQNDAFARIHWEVQYTFSRTNRKVHNCIDASMDLENGLIKRHIDVFPLRTWAAQALGWQGRLLGGTGFFKKKLQAQTQKTLQRYRAKHDPTFSNLSF